MFNGWPPVLGWGGAVLAVGLFVEPPVPAPLDARLTGPFASTWVDDHFMRIGGEVAGKPPHAWAGVYAEGDGLGVNIRLALAPHGGFAYRWRGCLGYYDQDAGTVTLGQEGELQLTGTFARDTAWRKPRDTAFLPVVWDQRHYLVPTAKMHDFLNAIHAGDEPRTGNIGRVLLRMGDQERSAGGLPDLPHEWRDLLRTTPLETHLTAVERIPDRQDILGHPIRRYSITVPVGRTEKVFPHMRLMVVEPPDLFIDVEMTAVRDHQASGVIELWNGDPPELVPQVGWRLSSRSPYALSRDRDNAGGTPAIPDSDRSD